MSRELAERDTAAREIIRDAGKLAMDYFAGAAELDVESKGLQDRVSIADREVERLIAEALRARYPQDGFLGEETGVDGDADVDAYTWVVDPIDGTDCFVHQIPAWCISIGLLHADRPAAGYILHPPGGELFHGYRGAGAFVNGEPIATSAATRITDGIVGIGFSHRREPASTIEVLERLCAAGGIFQRNGSAALTLAYVASGRLLGFAEGHINSWDVLAGLLLVEEAGGRCSAFLDNNGLHQGNPVLACAAGVEQELIEITSPLFQPGK